MTFLTIAISLFLAYCLAMMFTYLLEDNGLSKSYSVNESGQLVVDGFTIKVIQAITILLLITAVVR